MSNNDSVIKGYERNVDEIKFVLPLCECREGNRLPCKNISIEAPAPICAVMVHEGISPIGCSWDKACVRYPTHKDDESAEDGFQYPEDEKWIAECVDLIKLDAIIDERGVDHDKATWEKDMHKHMKETIKNLRKKE